MSTRRTEPSAYLMATKGQQRLAYVPAASTDIRALFIKLAARDEQKLSASKSGASSTRVVVLERKA